MAFARKGSRLAQAMRDVVGEASGRRAVADAAGAGRGASDQKTATGTADTSSARDLHSLILVKRMNLHNGFSILVP